MTRQHLEVPAGLTPAEIIQLRKFQRELEDMGLEVIQVGFLAKDRPAAVVTRKGEDRG